MEARAGNDCLVSGFGSEVSSKGHVLRLGALMVTVLGVVETSGGGAQWEDRGHRHLSLRVTWEPLPWSCSLLLLQCEKNHFAPPLLPIKGCRSYGADSLKPLRLLGMNTAS